MRGTDLFDAKINEKQPSKERLEVEKIKNYTTRLRYDFCAPDVPANGGDPWVGPRRISGSWMIFATSYLAL